MMLSRALGLAAVTLLVGWCTAGQVVAQENLEAGKSPSQIFSGTCTACHKSARGLLKTVAPSSLQGFLRQHYTTSPEMAGVLASYLLSNGATDTRYGAGDRPRGAKEAREGKEGREAKSEAKPGLEPAGVPGESEHPARRGKRFVHPTEQPEGVKPAAEGEKPAQAASEQAARKPSVKQRLGKRGKRPPEEAPKATDAAVEPAAAEPKAIEPAESAKDEPAKDKVTESSKGEAAKVEPAQSQPASSTETSKAIEPAQPAASASQPAIAEPAKEGDKQAGREADAPPPSRPDPVPAVTAAPAASAPSAAPADAPAASGGPATSVAPAAAAGPAAPTTSVSETPAMTASAPSTAATPANPPEPPISR